MPSCRKSKILFYLITALLFFAEYSPAQQETVLTSFLRNTEYRTLTKERALESRTADLRADSGSMMVTENRNVPSSRLIRIPIVRIRSLDTTSRIPVFWLSGGPGQSNMHSFQYDYFLTQHDHVMVGYRGVDGEVSLDCPEVVEVLQQGGDILSEEVIAGVSDAYGACAERISSRGVRERPPACTRMSPLAWPPLPRR